MSDREQVTTSRNGSAERMRLARLLSSVERADDDVEDRLAQLPPPDPAGWVVGVTGPPGAGKSTLVNALITAYRGEGLRVAVLAVDPSSPYTGGAVLGDRLRMIEHVDDEGVYIRSLASRGQLGGLAAAVPTAVRACLAYGYPRVIVETVGVGQGEVDIARHADTTVLVTAPGLGDSVQASKAGVLEIADVLVVNKSDRDGAKDVERDLTAMVRLNATAAHAWRVPVVLTRADTGDGVADLRTTVEAHRDHAHEHGEAERRRARRRLETWHSVCENLARHRLAYAYDSDTGRELAEDVAAGRITPSMAAQQLCAGAFDAVPNSR